MTKIPYGNWSISHGLDINIEEKWIRRRNLQKAHFNIASLPARPYITEMNEVQNGLFDMAGIFAEVFFSIHVK
jgi:hypothetical protein